jgi:hypothetical protein
METRFSLRATAAFALAGMATTRPDVFSDANASAPALKALRDRVTVELTQGLALTESAVEVDLGDGRTLRAQLDAGIPMRDRAAQGHRVAEKFHALVAPILGRDRSGLIAAQVNRLEELSHLGDLMRLCV